MSSSRFALVSDDQQLAFAIQSSLKKSLGQTALVSQYDSIRNHLWPDTNGVLILATNSSAESEQIIRLVQEIRLQNWPPVLVVLGADVDANSFDLSRLDPYIAKRFLWPSDAESLTHLVKERMGRCRSFVAVPQEESLEDRIYRRLITHTPSLAMLVKPLALAAAHDVTVLLGGETGTGKTFLARLIHEFSPRRSHRFLVVPCGALAANLVESEFFGHARGSFTGADQAKVGKFAAAGEGTLLLDEIDALGLEQQANLLRVIETGEFEPVGSNETQICRARIIVASNWNLAEAVDSGKFRRDLYYRLNVMGFYLPALRERIQDIGPLVRGMAARFNAKFQKDLFEISPEAIAALEAFPWPGNIRQLENVIQQSVLVSSGPALLPKHLPQLVVGYAARNGANGSATADSLDHSRSVLERAVIQRALVNASYSRTRAASALGISRVTLYKKMKKYGLMELPLNASDAQRALKEAVAIGEARATGA